MEFGLDSRPRKIVKKSRKVDKNDSLFLYYIYIFI